MILFKVQVFVMMACLAMCRAHTGKFPAAQTFECPVAQEYQCCTEFAPELLLSPDESPTSAALGSILDVMQGWWAALLGVTEVKPQTTEDLTCFINTSLLEDASLDPASGSDDEEDVDFKVWIPGDWELSPVIFSTQAPGHELNSPAVDDTPDEDEFEMHDLNQDKLHEAARSNSDAPIEEILANLTFAVVDDVMPFQPLTDWQTISALVDWFLTQILVNKAASARLQMKSQEPYTGTMQMMTSAVTSTPHDFITVDLRGEIRPGEVPIEKPTPPAWATRTVCLAFVCVCLCLLSPVYFTGDERKEKARLVKALKRRRGNDHRSRCGRRFAAYMNTRGRK